MILVDQKVSVRITVVSCGRGINRKVVLRSEILCNGVGIEVIPEHSIPIGGTLTLDGVARHHFVGGRE
jgi:hypothetical protein